MYITVFYQNGQSYELANKINPSGDIKTRRFIVDLNGRNADEFQADFKYFSGPSQYLYAF